MHFQYFMIKNQLEVLILKPKMEQLHFATASVRNMKDVSNREGLDSIQIFLYQEKVLIKSKCVCFILRCWGSLVFGTSIFSLMLQVLRWKLPIYDL